MNSNILTASQAGMPMKFLLALTLALLGALLITTVSAADGDPGLPATVSLTVLAPTPHEVVTGPVLAIHVISHGYRIDTRYAGTPNQTKVGNYQEMLDGKLIDLAPYRDGNRDTISMMGVSVGPHVLTVVPANNDNSTIGARAVSVPFYYQGLYIPEPAGYSGNDEPSITITAPADGSTVQGSSFSMTVDISNFVLCGDCFGKALVSGEGHWHVFLDQVDMPHMLTMAGDTTQTVSLKGVTPGWHTFYVALVPNDHMPIMFSTVTSVSLYVRSAG